MTILLVEAEGLYEKSPDDPGDDPGGVSEYIVGRRT